MARKNLLSGLMDDSKKFTAVNNEDEPLHRDEKQQITYKGIGALGAVTRSIDALAAKADAAKAIEEKLATGETVIDLDPALIEDSFVTDRVAHTDEQFRELVEAIRLRGQDSPILVRPHPEKDGRYQIAFGHRRARAAKELGRPVRAVVKKLDDRDHGVDKLLPGLTGWAQINGRDELPIPEKVKFDVEYLERRSFGFDISILFMTAEKVIRRKGIRH